MAFEFVKTENDVHVFIDPDGNKHKVGISVGTPEQARELLEQQFNTPAPAETYVERRRKAYNDAGLTQGAFTLAFIQKELDGDTAALDAYKAARANIKKGIPKN